MQSNKLRTAIRATAAAAVLGVAGQAGAVSFTAGDYDMAVYGYARFNASYDIDSNQALSTRSGSYAGLAGNDDAAEGHFGADAFQSRIGVKATSPEGVMVNVEGDFRGGGGGSLRLRHAYGSYMGVLAGQTWSNFTSFVGNTSTLDFDSLPGVAGFQSRTPQVRYTTGPLSLSLEDPRSSFVTDAANAAQKQGMPALTARLEDSAGGVSYSAAVLAHQVGYDTGTADETSFGFATFVAGKLALSDMITVQGSLSYTDGANSYLYRSGDNFGAASAYVDGAGDVETISGYGGTIGTGISLGGGRSVNIGYGMVEVDWDDAEADGVAVADESETNSAIMANYQWTPVKNVMMGVEYARLSRENVDGTDGDANRILFAAQYNF
ncbi:DcaP family trimeric outer membrane transporter [Marinobacter qingdaonensis]|uniref:DcaP family trimeric outer membrane transporter n=1 Tax=Marinobacter qingdaonensis TaxID=3108486 RepID=A0ABU5NYN2_9GAMM|nr:DcaP family trimeric outer membrane transporter [Marinobacter sp. ASW11-75]MEA1080822.1 DcaP family trimeric outer membrane transporter [Marinobacter sp. ASW11-75]